MIADMHLHSDYSGDCVSPMRETVEKAIKIGLKIICFTDHQDRDYPYDDGNFEIADLNAYQTEILALKEEYKNRLEILFGIELGLQPHLAAYYKELTRSYPFDFCIGSSHLIHGQDPYYPEYFAERTEKKGYLEYFESILENINACDDFDVYGHLDYVVRYGPTKNSHVDYLKSPYIEIIDEILSKIISMGKGIECNTSGYKYGLGHPCPHEDILKRYKELGGEILTVGSDSHNPAHLGYEFEKTRQLLLECGFQYYSVFRKRTPEFLPL